MIPLYPKDDLTESQGGNLGEKYCNGNCRCGDQTSSAEPFKFQYSF